jgi:hypothetical protein
MDELIDAIDLLIDSDLGAALEGQSLDGFTQDSYGLTELEARDFIREYLPRSE